MAETYTIADLCALDNDALDTLAAELHGWRLEEDEYPPELAPMRKCKTVPVWIDSNGHFTGYAPASMAGYLTKWTPTTDFNQSRELLAWASAPFDGAITKEPILFDITFGRFDRNERLPMIEAYQPEFAEQGYEKRMEWTGGNKWLVQIPGNDARAEVTAYCAAILAMAGRLTEGK